MTERPSRHTHSWRRGCGAGCSGLKVTGSFHSAVANPPSWGARHVERGYEEQFDGFSRGRSPPATPRETPHDLSRRGKINMQSRAPVCAAITRPEHWHANMNLRLSRVHHVPWRCSLASTENLDLKLWPMTPCWRGDTPSTSHSIGPRFPAAKMLSWAYQRARHAVGSAQLIPGPICYRASRRRALWTPGGPASFHRPHESAVLRHGTYVPVQPPYPHRNRLPRLQNLACECSGRSRCSQGIDRLYREPSSLKGIIHSLVNPPCLVHASHGVRRDVELYPPAAG